MTSFSVYIIFSPTIDKFYTGYTADIEKRLKEHNSGLSSFTAKANDWILKYSEQFATREEAMAREKEIKNKKSRKYIVWLISSSDNYKNA
ncbi:MAG: GIY-YIG nuclease family protein [Bacteroidetes bacterium]|nr:GIY-YIG nuclease family protein [Bacteroidota bacterium]